ncbi:LysM domain-containing protein [Paraphaeosphaeria sporulosa]
MVSSTLNLLFFGGLIKVASARNPHLNVRGTTPVLPHDASASKFCSWWVDLDEPITCSALLDENFITLEDFRRWNPSVPAECDSLKVGQSYCVEALSEPPPSQSSSSPPSKSSTLPPPTSASSTASLPGRTLTVVTQTTLTTVRPSTTSAPGNGIPTPSPLQPSIVDNCDEFYFVQLNDGCEAIARAHGITLNEFLTWNPEAGPSCVGLWAEAYACISVVGVSLSFSSAKPSTTATPSTTVPGNGIATPTPVQANIVKNCDSFYLVKGRDNCYDIGKAHGVSSAQIITWNPAVGSSCGTLWPDYVRSILSSQGRVPLDSPLNFSTHAWKSIFASR